MSGIARIMAARGMRVSGSDLHESSSLDALRALGIDVHIGHDARYLDGADIVVRSAAIPDSNPEIHEARARAIPVLERATALASLMENYTSIAVAGTHGKTTTTSMVTVALQHCHLDPSFAIGATMRNSGTNAHHGSGDIFIVEADESDGSFVAYKPKIAVITNIELDHVDNFKDIESIYQLFHDFIATIPQGGTLIACSDDAGVRHVLSGLSDEIRQRITIITYGENDDPDLRIDRIYLGEKNASARIIQRGQVLGELKIAIPGRHNILNATAALGAGIAAGAHPQQLIAGLELFSGARRRFEIKGSVAGITVIDDYGHHPTEITATLETARRFVGSGRVFVIFQPHRFSRTQAFADRFASALNAADHTYLLEIYPASEKPIPGVTSLLISQKMASGSVTYEPSMPTVIERVIDSAQSGDLIITLGAGDVSALAPLIVANLEARHGAK